MRKTLNWFQFETFIKISCWKFTGFQGASGRVNYEKMKICVTDVMIQSNIFIPNA